MRGKGRNIDVNVSDLTLRDSKFDGVYGNGASFHLENVNIEKSEECGVWVEGTTRNTMKNCNVSHSYHSGVYVYKDGLMTIDGNATSIHHNCKNGGWGWYALDASSSSSSIYLVSPLKKESICLKNGGGGKNYGGNGTIKTIANNNTKEEKK